MNGNYLTFADLYILKNDTQLLLEIPSWKEICKARKFKNIQSSNGIRGIIFDPQVNCGYLPCFAVYENRFKDDIYFTSVSLDKDSTWKFKFNRTEEQVDYYGSIQREKAHQKLNNFYNR